MQVVCKKVVTSSSVASPKFWGECFDCQRGTVLFLEHCLSKHKTTRYARNLRGHGPLGPFWLRLWLQDINEKKRRVAYLLDVQSSTDKKLAMTQDSQTLRNSDENNIVSIGCYICLLPTCRLSAMNCLLKLYVIVKSVEQFLVHFT